MSTVTVARGVRELATVDTFVGLEVAVEGAITGEVAVADGTRIGVLVSVALTVKVTGGVAVEPAPTVEVAVSGADVVVLSEA